MTFGDRPGRSAAARVALRAGLALLLAVLVTAPAVVAVPSAYAAMVPTGYYRIAWSGEIDRVDAAAHTVTPLTMADWAAAGYPAYTTAPIRYVHYAWSPSISGVTMYDPADKATWRWGHLDQAAWARVGGPTPVVADYVGGSRFDKWATSGELFVTDPGGFTHKLTYAEWRAAGFPAFTDHPNEGFLKLAWDPHVARMGDLAGGQGGPLTYAQWTDAGQPTPAVVQRVTGDLIYHAPGDPTLWYAGPTVNRPITYSEWVGLGAPAPALSTWATPFASWAWQACSPTLAGVTVSVAATQRTVTVARAHDGTYATLSMFARTDAACGFTQLFSDPSARIGYGGLSDGATRKQGTGTTPAGTYTMSEAFGIAGNPGAWLPVRIVGQGDYWVEDNNSAYYNQYRNSAQGGFDPYATGDNSSERLLAYPGQYDYAVVVNFNRPPDSQVPYRGAGIFVHVNGSGATAGCVSTTRANVVTMLAYLRPGDRITITG